MGSSAQRTPADRDIGESAYLALLRRILDEGSQRSDRTGTGTISVFGAQIRFDLRDGFPLITTKKVAFSSVVRELLWILSGSTNVRDLGAPIWNEWADPDGDLGPIYGHQWRFWGADPKEIADLTGVYRAAIRSASHPVTLDDRRARLLALTTLEPDGPRPGASGGASPDPGNYLTRRAASKRDAPTWGIDQIDAALHTIKTNPSSRRIVVSAWNVRDLPRMHLPPCHLLFQFYVSDGHLDCQLYQRSADMALGVPFNIASYALLLSMFATECRLIPRYFVHTFGDAHVYLNHVDGIRLQLERDPLPPPRLLLAQKPVLEQAFEDVRIDGYQHHPAIKFEVSV